MDRREYRVSVTCRQHAVYRVEANDAEAARHDAIERWRAGEAGDLAGLDYGELDSVGVYDAPDPARDAEDDELLLRYIRERESLLARLGGTAAEPSLNDAISATQAASDLGWYRETAQQTFVDTLRAAFALERLCGRRELVCFERARARERERGTVRLYCTPSYLESLTTELEQAAPPTRR